MNKIFIIKKYSIRAEGSKFGFLRLHFAVGMLIALCSLIGCVLFISCGSIPTVDTVPPNLTPTEIKQLAQEEFDKGNNRNSMAYYEILIMRYGSDISIRTSAEFEIAHILLKRKKWAEADQMLETIIARYESTGGAAITPKYYILAKNDYKITQAKLKKKAKHQEPKVQPEVIKSPSAVSEPSKSKTEEADSKSTTTP